jgi:NADH:ubiquinone oxidoreductase subunit D
MNKLVIGSGLPTNKAEIAKYNENIKEVVLSGDADIIKMARSVNIMKKIVENFEKEPDIQAVLLTEVQKYGKGELSEIQVKEVGTKYDFSSCGHATYDRLAQQLEEIKSKMKIIEESLKLRDIVEVDPETGEVFEAKKATKQSTTKVVFTIK